MAIDRSARYPGRFDVPTLAQPQGAFKNKTGPTAVDGTYLEKDWANDFAGFFSSLLQGVSANGSVDEVGASQYYTALLNSPAFTGIPSAPTASQGTSTTQIASTAFVETATGVVIGSNSNGFYRIYPDGFIEQRGRLAGGGSSVFISVTFPVAMSNTDYTLIGVGNGDAAQSGNSYGHYETSSLTTSTALISVIGANKPTDWILQGY